MSENNKPDSTDETVQYDFRRLHPLRNINQPLDNAADLRSNTNRIQRVFKLSDIKFLNSSPFSSSVSSDDFNLKTDRHSFNEYRQIPRLEVYEIQTGSFYPANKLMIDVIRGGQAVVETFELLGEFLPGLTTAVIRELKDLLGMNETAPAPPIADQTPDDQQQSQDKTIARIKQIISGRYLGYYEIPFKGDLLFLNADGTSGWNYAGQKNSVISKVQSFMSKALPFDIDTIQMWNAPNDIEKQTIKVTLDLYNDNLDNLIKNFKYIHTLASGAFWLKDGFTTIAPNVYNVHFPGHFRYYYCAMTISVSNSGNKRKLTEDGFARFNNVCHTADVFKDTFFPDVYSLNITFTSLIPNNFNVYLDYYLKGQNDAEIKVGTKTSDSAFNQINNVATKVKNLLKSPLAKVRSGVQSLGESPQ